MNTLKMKFVGLMICLMAGSVEGMNITYPKTETPNSAGTLFYKKDSDGLGYLLLGHQKVDGKMVWADFGGKQDPKDKGHISWTAAREGAEEISFIKDDITAKFITDVQGDMQKSKTYDTIFSRMDSKKVHNYKYMQYYVEYPFDDLGNDKFKNNVKLLKQFKAPHDFYEVTEIAWIPFSVVKHAIDQSVKGSRFDKDNVSFDFNGKKYQLSPWTAFSICKALYRDKILENIMKQDFYNEELAKRLNQRQEELKVLMDKLEKDSAFARKNNVKFALKDLRDIQNELERAWQHLWALVSNTQLSSYLIP